jgi:hypothetical protein
MNPQAALLQMPDLGDVHGGLLALSELASLCLSSSQATLAAARNTVET